VLEQLEMIGIAGLQAKAAMAELQLLPVRQQPTEAAEAEVLIRQLHPAVAGAVGQVVIQPEAIRLERQGLQTPAARVVVLYLLAVALAQLVRLAAAA
jgi:hypothetical protein